VGELSTGSEEFRQLWAARNVRLHTGTKRFGHPSRVSLILSYDNLHLGGHDGPASVDVDQVVPRHER
jgi:hypothetical protein